MVDCPWSMAIAYGLLTIKHKTMSKKKYVKPSVKKIIIDNQISMVMMSFGPSGDPESSIKLLNPLRWWK